MPWNFTLLNYYSNIFSKMFKIDYYIYKYFLTSKMAALTKICLTVIHFYTAYLKRRITSSASDSHTVLHTLWHIGPVFGVYKSSVWSMLDPLWSMFLFMLLLFGRNSNNFLTYKKTVFAWKNLLNPNCNVYAILKNNYWFVSTWELHVLWRENIWFSL
jgi:hypothetical protein